MSVACVANGRRRRLQALVMLNGPQFVEAARALAARVIAQHGDDEDATLIDMFPLADRATDPIHGNCRRSAICISGNATISPRIRKIARLTCRSGNGAPHDPIDGSAVGWPPRGRRQYLAELRRVHDQTLSRDKCRCRRSGSD